jgi:hypothetical protein
MYVELLVGMNLDLEVDLLDSMMLMIKKMKLLYLNGLMHSTFLAKHILLLDYIKKTREFKEHYQEDHT